MISSSTKLSIVRNYSHSSERGDVKLSYLFSEGNLKDEINYLCTLIRKVQKLYAHDDIYLDLDIDDYDEHDIDMRKIEKKIGTVIECYLIDFVKGVSLPLDEYKNDNAQLIMP